MQKRIDRKKYSVKIFIFFLAVLLAACGKGNSSEIPEKSFSIEYTENLSIMLPEQVICSQGCAWGITTAKDDFIYKITSRSGASGLEEIKWQPEEGDCFLINIAERDGTLYAEFYNRKEDGIEIRKYPAYGGWSDVMSLKLEGEGWYTMGSGLYVDDREKVYLVNGHTVACFDGEGKRTGIYELKGEICSFQENEKGVVECVTVGTKGVILYALGESKAEEKWTWKDAEMIGQVRGIESNEADMLCLATNQELLFFDRVSGVLSSRTDLVKLGISSVLAGYYDAEGKILRLYGSAGNDAEGLRYSLLRESDSFTEQRAELVYGMVGGVNADTSASIWTAITEFNQENKDYYVSIRNYDNNLERLYADMAAGNGPDIIDMTYSEYYESYVKNGYLEDLSPYLEQSQYRDDIIWNALDAYRIDGGLYVFVPQFQLRGVLIHPEYDIDEWNLDTFLELVEQNQWEKDIMGDTGYPENLLRFMLCCRQEEFIDWEQKEAFFEEPEFLNMLALCREYADADWFKAEEWTYKERKWNSLCTECVLGGMFSSYLSNTDIYGREHPIYGYPTSSGQTYGIMACADSCAIYSGSSRKEGAWEFIESLLSESNQRCLGIVNPGFPIRDSVLKKMAENAESENLLSDGEMLTMTEREIEILEDVIYNGDLSRILLDRDIWSVIYEETAPYFAGDKTAEDVAHIIQSRVEIILQE